MEAPVQEGPELEVAPCQVVRKRPAERLRELPRPPPDVGPGQQGGHDLRGRARGRADAHLPPAPPGGLQDGQRAHRLSASPRGDRVAIYMPMVPEAAIAMLGCARIGVIHTVIFGGFLERGDQGPGERLPGAGHHHRRRRLAPRPRRRAEGQRRPRPAGHPDASSA